MSFTQNGSGFTNLQKIIDANKQNQLGSTIQSGITDQANNISSDLSNSYGQFQNDVSNNALDTAANRQQVKNTLGKFGDSPNQNIDISNGNNGTFGNFNESAPRNLDGTPTGPSSDVSNTQPSSSSSSPNLSGGDINAFTKFRAGAYNGPQQLNNISNIQNQAQSAQQLGQSVNNAGGRQSLLQQFVGGGNQYNQGEQQLDNLILGSTGGANLQAAQQATNGLVSQVNQANSSATNLANQTASNNKAFADFTNQQINNAYNPISAALDATVAGANATEATREAQIQALKDILSRDPSSYSNSTTFDGPALDSNAGGYNAAVAKNSAAAGQNVINQLTKMGFIGTTKTEGPVSQDEVNKLIARGVSGRDPSGNDYYTSNDGKTNIYTDPNGNIIDESNAENGVSLTNSDQQNWINRLQELQNFNTNKPIGVSSNFNQDISQAIIDNQATNINRAGLVNSNQAARLNALNQLAGRSNEFNLTPTTTTAANGTVTTAPNIGNYIPGSNGGFNESQALNAIRAVTNPDHLAVANDSVTPEIIKPKFTYNGHTFS